MPGNIHHERAPRGNPRRFPLGLRQNETHSIVWRGGIPRKTGADIRHISQMNGGVLAKRIAARGRSIPMG